MDWDFSSWSQRQQRAQAAARSPMAGLQGDYAEQADAGAARPSVLPPDQRRLPMFSPGIRLPDRVAADDPRLADFMRPDADLRANAWAFNGGHPPRAASPAAPAAQAAPAAAQPAPTARNPTAGLQGDYAEQAAAGAPRGSGRPRAYTPADFADDTEGMTYRQLRFAAGLLPPPHHPTGRDQMDMQALRIHQANLAGAQQRGQQPFEDAMKNFLDFYMRVRQPNGFLLGQSQE